MPAATTCADLRARGSVAIVGAGPAGLTLARLLQRRGFAVMVLERDASPTARRQGGSLDLRPSLAQRAIDAAGLNDEIARWSRPDASGFAMYGADGVALPGMGGETHEDAGPEIDRGDLRGVLLDSVAPGTVAWGSIVRQVARSDDGRWRLEVEGRPAVVADLVVGADGMHSAVRARLTPETPRYTGHVMLAATIRRDRWRGTPLSDLLGEGSAMFAGGERTIFVQRCARDLILVYFSLRVAADWPRGESFAIDDGAAVLGFLRDQYADWSPELIEMVTEVDPSFHRWPLFVMPPACRWATQPGLTMIGDAAHAMPPFTGKGVNLAMVDALELADALTADPAATIASALARFEAGMQDRTVAETGACLAVGGALYGIDLEFGPAG